MDYELKDGMICPLNRSTANDWTYNLQTIQQWSPYRTELDLFTQVKIVICFRLNLVLVCGATSGVNKSLVMSCLHFILGPIDFGIVTAPLLVCKYAFLCIFLVIQTGFSQQLSELPFWY